MGCDAERLSAAIDAKEAAMSEEDATYAALQTALDRYQAATNRRAIAVEEADETGEAYAIAAVKSRLATKTANKTKAEATRRRRAKVIADRRLAEAREAG